MLAKGRLAVKQRDLGFQRALQSGVKIAHGSDAGVYVYDQKNRDFALMLRNGMTPIDVLKAVTSSAADLCGTADRGQIARGMLADIVAVAGDPRLDISTLEKPMFILLGGKKIALS